MTFPRMVYNLEEYLLTFDKRDRRAILILESLFIISSIIEFNATEIFEDINTHISVCYINDP